MAELSFTTSASIAASPEAVWQALIDPAWVSRYYLAPLKILELMPGGAIRYGTAERDVISGQIVDFTPRKKLVHTFCFHPEQAGVGGDPETSVCYLIEAVEGGTKVTLTHYGFPEENQTYVNISGGWPSILAGLKKALEEG